jgi:NADH-quinone oxidoreductase subunit M
MLAMLGAFRPAPFLDRTLFLVLMAFAGLGTVLTAAYLLMLVRRTAQGPTPERWRNAPLLGDARTVELAAWSPLALAIVVLGSGRAAARPHRPGRRRAAGGIR